MTKLEIIQVKIKDLKEYPNNPKIHTDKQIKQIIKSIQKFGFNDPIAIDADNQIIEGHGRVLAAKELGMETVPAIRLPHLTEKQKKAYIIAHNKLTMNTGFNPDRLYKEIKTLLFDPDLIIGFEDMELADLQELSVNEILEDKDPDETPPLPDDEEIIIKHGDIMELGRHKLICGDSTFPGTFKDLMGNEKARMVFTDPPYGVSYTGVNNPNGRNWGGIKNDDLRGDDLYLFLLDAFKNVFDYTIENPALYVFYASATHIQFEEALKAAGFKVKQQLIWDKGMVLCHSDYHWTHEPILYCSKKKNCEWFGNRRQKTLWKQLDIDDLELMEKEELIEILRELKEGSTVWKIKKDFALTYIHPTQKPVELAVKAIINSSKIGDIILEPFAGSGSTIIGCEITNRKCRAVEYDPKFCQLIVDRWCKYTGGDNIKINNKEVNWEDYKTEIVEHKKRK